MKRGLRILRELVDLLLALLIGAAIFLLFSEAGARLVLEQVEARTGLIHVEGVEGRLWGPLTLHHFRYEDPYVRVDVEQAQLDASVLQLLRGRVSVAKLQAQSARIVIKPGSPDAAPEPGGPALTRLPVGLDIAGLQLGYLDIEGASASPMHFEQVRLNGTWLGDRVRLASLSARTPWVGQATVTADARLRADGIDISQLHADGFATADLQGRLAYREASDLRLVWSAMRWPPSGEATASSSGGQLHWQGRFDDWRYTLAGQLAIGPESLEISGSGRGTLRDVTAERLSVDSGHGRFEGQATATWNATPTVTVDGQIERLEPQHWLTPLAGEINGRIHIDAAFPKDAPVASVSVRAERSVLNGHALSLVAAGSYAANRLWLQRFDLQPGASTLSARGSVWPKLSLAGRIDSQDLSGLWPPLAGSVHSEVQLRGTTDQPGIAGHLHAQGLRYDSYQAKRVDATFDLDPLGPLQLDAQLRGLEAGQRIDSAQLQLRGRLPMHRLSVDLQVPQGKLSAIFDGGYDRAAAVWQGALSNATLTTGELPPWTLSDAATLRVAGAEVELSPACFGSVGTRACVSLRPVDGVRRVSFVVDHFQLATLNPWLPGGAQASGEIGGEGYVDLGADGLSDLRVQMKNGPVRLVRGNLPALAMRPGQLDVHEDAGRLLLNADIPFDQGGVHAAAELAPGPELMQRAVEGHVQVEVPTLAWLSVFNYELDDVAGRLDGKVDIAGTLASPEFSGRIELADGGLRLRSPGIRLEQIQGSLSGDTSGALAVEAEAQSGGGRVQVTGSLDPWQAQTALKLTVTGDNFLALHTPDASVWISPKLDVAMGHRELHVTGSVVVPRARITPRAADTGVGPSADQVIIRKGDDTASDDRLALYTDIDLQLGDDVRFDGMGLKTQLGGAVRVRDEPGAPTRARGELQLIGGRYKAYGQDLTLETGRLLFTGAELTRPAVELRATRSPTKDVTVGVQVRGRLDQPEFSLFSTPTMPQEAQLSWLVLGRSLDTATGSAADRAMVADAALSLGLAGGEWLAQRLGNKLGVDEVTIGARPGATSDQAQFTIGKYLSPRLFVSYGVSLFQPGQSLRLQYDIGNGFKLETETGTQSGGDLLYTVEH